MTTVRKPAAERQNEIVEMTLRLLSELGEGGLSTQTIADHVSITQAGIFRHFPTKNNLWIAILTEIERRGSLYWEHACRKCDPSIVRLRKTPLAQLKPIEDYPAILKLLFLTGRFAAEEVVHPINVRPMTAFRLRIAEELSVAVQECGRRIQIDTLDLESLLLEVIQNCVLRWSLSGSGFDLVAEGDRLIGLRLCLSGLEAGGDKS